ncbi:MAG: DMT family transporter [Betaproteobacteria bacterium]|nr:DMT family transporter [Betaproteobacteria bacterium]MDE2621616.1 DMT family transporter [Betaproteobacteria bacterium]
MLVAGLSFAVMGLFVKLGAPDFSPAELVFYRSFFGLIPMVLFALRQRQPLATIHWRLHLVRSVAGLISLWLYFFALTQLPLATAVTLNYTSPLFLALLMTVLSREKLNRPLLLTLVSGFMGILLVLRPHLGPDQWFAGVLGLLSGFGAGVAYLNVRAMGELGEPEWRIVLYFTALSTIVLGIYLLFVPRHPITRDNLWVLVALGGAATLGQLTMTRAYRTGSTWLVANFAYSAIVFSSFLGILFFREWLSWSGWLGVAIVIVAGITASQQVRRKNVSRHKQEVSL